MLEFCNGVHWDAEMSLTIDASWEKFEVISPLTSKSGIAGILLLLKKRFIIFI